MVGEYFICGWLWCGHAPDPQSVLHHPVSRTQCKTGSCTLRLLCASCLVVWLFPACRLLTTSGQQCMPWFPAMVFHQQLELVPAVRRRGALLMKGFSFFRKGFCKHLQSDHSNMHATMAVIHFSPAAGVFTCSDNIGGGLGEEGRGGRGTMLLCGRQSMTGAAGPHSDRLAGV